MARLREFDYEQVLDGALQLFWRGGYEATSLDGLLNEVGLSKSSFYGAFGSKHEMLLASLDRYIETVLQANIDDLRCGSPREAIIRSFEKILGFQPSSKTCFLQVCAIELAGQDQLVRMRVRRGLELFEEAYRNTIVRGQEAGEFAVDADARVLYALVSGPGKTGDFLPGIRKAIDNGLSADDALRAVTLSPARILGVDRQLGSLEKFNLHLSDDVLTIVAAWGTEAGSGSDATTPVDPETAQANG